MGKGYGRFAMKIFAGASIGIVLMAVEKIFYEQGVLIDEFTTGTISLTDFQIITLFIFVLVGVIVGIATD